MLEIIIFLPKAIKFRKLMSGVTDLVSNMQKHEGEAYDDDYVLMVLHAAHLPFINSFKLGERISSVSESTTSILCMELDA